MKYPRNLVAAAVALAVSATFPLTSVAQDDEAIEEVVTVGSRSAKPRSAGDSPVPVDILSADDLSAMGNTADLTDNIKALVPSYTASPATGDGSAFVRPTSLRGTAPDQSLVLVNGKRRHRSALVQFFAPAAGNGAHGVDIGMIPGIAVKRIEVLRDGAASQYGSDAIAGVINFVMKDAAEGGQVMVQGGEHFDGGNSVKVAANGGIGIGDSGFINASIEYQDNDALSRGVQRQADYDRLIADGVPASEIGADSPFNDGLLQSWGRPETEGTRFFLNSGFDISDNSQLYLRLGLAETDGRYRFFYRDENHSTLTEHRENGFTGLPAGFTPFLDGSQSDTTLVLGVDGEFDSGMLYDFSYGFGRSELDYFLNNTVNPALDLTADLQIPQMDFNVGGYIQKEVNLNADFSLPMSDNLNLAFGTEFREETYTTVAGEPNASLLPGSSGFRGIPASDAGEFSRENVAVYADLEHDITDKFLLQYAIRYENFNDFGSTINGKLAGRYRVNDAFAFRGAVSTGFHAPTPGQVNVRTTITTFDGVTGAQVEEGLLPTTDPRVLAVGGQPLSEENALNYSLGFTADFFENTTVTFDVYQIEVSDRIYRTGDIPFVSDDEDVPITSISFYTNALDVKHSGVDLVVTSAFEFGSASGIDLTLAYGYNKIDVTDQKLITTQDGTQVTPVSDGNVEDIENNYPQHRWVLTGNSYFGDKFNILGRINYYGEHYDERGRIGDPDDLSAQISSTMYLDLEAGWQFNDNWRVVLGGVNVTNEYIDTIGPPNANRLSVGLQYPRRTAANYEGGSWYLKGIFNW